MTEKTTIKRFDAESVMIVGADSATAPPYVAALEGEAYDVTLVPTAADASTMMPELMPHVVILTPSVPMADHRVVHGTALVVAAIVLVVPNNADPAAVSADVAKAVARSTKRRTKTVPPP